MTELIRLPNCLFRQHANSTALPSLAVAYKTNKPEMLHY